MDELKSEIKNKNLIINNLNFQVENNKVNYLK